MSVERQLEFTILSFIESTSGYRAGERKRGLDYPEGRTSLPDGNLEILLFAPFVAALSEALVRLEGVGGIKEGVRSSLVVTWTQGRGNKIAHRGLGRGRGIERLEGEVGSGRGARLRVSFNEPVERQSFFFTAINLAVARRRWKDSCKIHPKF